jgi:uncharacterized protein YbjT (DUF2867 family)
VLVTGGTGTLGREVVAALGERPGAAARILSRRARPSGVAQEWFRGDLVDADLAAVVRGADAVVHLASGKTTPDADRIGTRRLLAAARAEGVRHAVVISIIGCDRIPLPFYATKREVEGETRAGGVPWTIVRVAQFHSFVARLVSAAAAGPVPAPLAADLRFQPVDEREVADRLVEVALGPPLGDAPEIAGPEVLTLGEIAQAWLAATGRPATLVPITVAALLEGAPGPLRPEPWVGPVLAAYRDAWNAPRGSRTLGRVRFPEWIRRHPSAAAAG